ncbi:unnamed protein product [Amoebophrya sp. A25]|nr:unnamed protein product [Amoebophrya sp. A25]|eukprot:GSA25T00025668001.1
MDPPYDFHRVVSKDSLAWEEIYDKYGIERPPWLTFPNQPELFRVNGTTTLGEFWDIDCSGTYLPHTLEPAKFFGIKESHVRKTIDTPGTLRYHLEHTHCDREDYKGRIDVGFLTFEQARRTLQKVNKDIANLELRCYPQKPYEEIRAELSELPKRYTPESWPEDKVREYLWELKTPTSCRSKDIRALLGEKNWKKVGFTLMTNLDDDAEEVLNKYRRNNDTKGDSIMEKCSAIINEMNKNEDTGIVERAKPDEEEENTFSVTVGDVLRRIASVDEETAAALEEPALLGDGYFGPKVQQDKAFQSSPVHFEDKELEERGILFGPPLLDGGETSSEEQMSKEMATSKTMAKSMKMAVMKRNKKKNINNSSPLVGSNPEDENSLSPPKKMGKKQRGPNKPSDKNAPSPRKQEKQVIYHDDKGNACYTSSLKDKWFPSTARPAMPMKSATKMWTGIQNLIQEEEKEHLLSGSGSVTGYKPLNFSKKCRYVLRDAWEMFGAQYMRKEEILEKEKLLQTEVSLLVDPDLRRHQVREHALQQFRTNHDLRRTLQETLDFETVRNKFQLHLRVLVWESEVIGAWRKYKSQLTFEDVVSNRRRDEVADMMKKNSSFLFHDFMARHGSNIAEEAGLQPKLSTLEEAEEIAEDLIKQLELYDQDDEAEKNRKYAAKHYGVESDDRVVGLDDTHRRNDDDDLITSPLRHGGSGLPDKDINKDKHKKRIIKYCKEHGWKSGAIPQRLVQEAEEYYGVVASDNTSGSEGVGGGFDMKGGWTSDEDNIWLGEGDSSDDESEDDNEADAESADDDAYDGRAIVAAFRERYSENDFRQALVQNHASTSHSSNMQAPSSSSSSSSSSCPNAFRTGTKSATASKNTLPRTSSKSSSSSASSSSSSSTSSRFVLGAASAFRSN